MIDGTSRLFNGAAFHRQHDVTFGLSANLNHTRPVHDAVAASAADRRAGHLAAFGAALFNGNVLRVKMHEPVCDAREPFERILTAEIRVARVEVDADGRAFDELINAIQSVRCVAVLLMAFEADENAARLRDPGSFDQGVAHEREIFGFSGPCRLRAFVGVNDRRATFSGKANGLFQVLDADLRFAKRRVRGNPGELHARALTRAANPKRVVEHGHAVEISRFAEQLTTPMDHGLNVRVAKLGRLFDRPLEGFVVMADEFEVNSDVDVIHNTGPLVRGFCASPE